MVIAILNYKDTVPTCVTGSADIWNNFSRMYPRLTGDDHKHHIEIQFIDSDGEIVYAHLKSTNRRRYPSAAVYDLIIIPPMDFKRIDQVLKRETALIKWLREQYVKGAELASICVGSFLLAATGLLTEKRATTNWLFADQFRLHFPDVDLDVDKVIVDQGRLHSCGGGFCFTSFMIYLIEKFCGHQESIIASKIMMINVHDQTQSSFSMFRFQHAHSDKAIAATQEYIEKNYSKPLTLENLAGRSNMSVRHFIRRFEWVTGNTPLQYQQLLRVEAAKKMLEVKDNSEAISQVSADCGYEDKDYFCKIFKRHVGMTPRAYREKFGRTTTICPGQTPILHL
jgi:transcriptional regulator GlxA family with amidase domain